MRVYIAGPITGINDYMERFSVAEKQISEYDRVSVINPAKVSSCLPKDFTWAEYMDVTLELLKHCHCIYMLKGWEKSTGAKIEHEIAIKRKMPVIYEDKMTSDGYKYLLDNS